MTRDLQTIAREVAWLKSYQRWLTAENTLLTAALMLIQADREDAVNHETARRFCEQADYPGAPESTGR